VERHAGIDLGFAPEGPEWHTARSMGEGRAHGTPAWIRWRAGEFSRGVAGRCVALRPAWVCGFGDELA